MYVIGVKIYMLQIFMLISGTNYSGSNIFWSCIMHHSKKVISNGKNGLNNTIKNTFLSEIRLHCNTFGPRLLLLFFICPSDKKEESDRQWGQLWKILTQWMKERSQTREKEREEQGERDRISKKDLSAHLQNGPLWDSAAPETERHYMERIM